MKLGIVYHMPFWREADGTLREIEGSFARYVDSLAPYFDEISLCVPVVTRPASDQGTAIRSPNVTLAPLPPFDGPVQFYPRLATVLPRLIRWARGIDLVHCRVPSPAAAFAFAIARLYRRPGFLLVVGDLRALLPSMPYRGMKKALWRIYTEFEERNVQWMVDHALTFANGAALAAKHTRPGRPVIETTTTTIHAGDIADRADSCQTVPVRVLTVSRIDPRKGLRALPAAVRMLVDDGIDVRFDLVGPAVGGPGREEQTAIVEEAVRLGVSDRVAMVGAVPLDRLLPMYRQYDVFVLPTLPGEGIPRVLLEAMSAGVPVITTRVAGIPSLITHEVNGVLLDRSRAEDVAGAVARIVRDGPFRRGVIAQGYETARKFTLEGQAARMMETVSGRLQVALRRPVALPAA
jgi:glycosyltransferase involved in cell wall biosynthesis